MQSSKISLICEEEIDNNSPSENFLKIFNSYKIIADHKTKDKQLVLNILGNTALQIIQKLEEKNENYEQQQKNNLLKLDAFYSQRIDQLTQKVEMLEDNLNKITIQLQQERLNKILSEQQSFNEEQSPQKSQTQPLYDSPLLSQFIDFDRTIPGFPNNWLDEAIDRKINQEQQVEKSIFDNEF